MSESTVFSKPPLADSSSTLHNWTRFQARQSKIPHEQIDRLLFEIEKPAERELMAAAFSSLLNLLQDVPALANVRQGDAGDGTEAVLERFRREATSLVDFIRTVATSSEDLDESLAETLDGIAFALNHDLKRTFDSELRELGWKSEDDFARGKIAYVRGLLTNCLQQSIITLAQVYDPALDGSKLFDNYQSRLRESLLLCRDLTDMVLLSHECERNIPEHFPDLVACINSFRAAPMQFLMYKDWEEFERMSESLVREMPTATGEGSPLHSFICYLETLLGQVKLRAVLVDVFCDFSLDGQTTDREWSEAQHRLAFELYRAELTSTIERSS